MIPDKKTYRVRDAVTRRSLGNVDEAFVLSLNDAGEDDDGTPRRFVIAGRTWLIVDADPEQSELLVAPVNDHGKAPQWLGELPPVPESVARDVGYLRHLIAHDLGLLEAPQQPELDPLALVPLEALSSSTTRWTTRRGACWQRPSPLTWRPPAPCPPTA